MSQFLLLLFEDEAAWAAATDAVSAEVLGEHQAFGQKHGPALAGGNALQPSPTAKIVRGDSVTDGPFAETKEALGGYYLVEADDVDAAVEIARDVPARFGYVEVRPIRTFG